MSEILLSLIRLFPIHISVKSTFIILSRCSSVSSWCTLVYVIKKCFIGILFYVY
uniref:Uncharacterized protein n=1 Tax=uncultured marine virus TaxID=186617 RepID=A0A0F7L357_9VIRU|nr:hypothetical protein [uncultured marine virus]